MIKKETILQKVDRIAGMVQATMGLENSGLSKEDLAILKKVIFRNILNERKDVPITESA